MRCRRNLSVFRRKRAKRNSGSTTELNLLFSDSKRSTHLAEFFSTPILSEKTCYKRPQLFRILYFIQNHILSIILDASKVMFKVICPNVNTCKHKNRFAMNAISWIFKELLGWPSYSVLCTRANATHKALTTFL